MALDIEVFLERHFDVIENYNRKRTDVRVDCPFCEELYGTGDYKQHLHVSVVKPVVHCFRCGYSGHWVRFVMDMTGKSYAFALGELYVVPKPRDVDNIWEKFEHRKEKNQSPVLKNQVLPKGFEQILGNPSPVARLAKRYLKRRGFKTSQWRRYNLGISPEYPSRIIIPIEGELWQARAITEWAKPKYINPEIEARHYIFNPVALNTYEEVVVTEGAFSAMAIGDNAIALVGKETPPEKLQRLLRSNVVRFSVALDADAGDASADLASRLHRGGKRVDVWIYEQGDPADGGKFDVMQFDARTFAALRLRR